MLNSPVAKIKERLGIEEVVSSYIKLERAGTNLKARCPFHNEKTPSFFLSPERGTYYCFGCGAKGDIFAFVEEFEGLDFKGALRMLAERAGVSLHELTEKDSENISEKDRLYSVMESATVFFEKNLNLNKEAQSYLKQRGLEDGTMRAFRLGYADSNWHDLSNFLLSKGFTEHEIEKAGLNKRAEKRGGGEVVYDRFRGRIMFPLMDSSGRVIAFSGRLFPDLPEAAKYLNSPETPIFKKSSVLYGLDKAKLAIRKHNFSIMVEGQMDLLLSHQAGMTNTVATSGTAFSEELEREEAVSNLGLLRRISSNVVFAFDGDNAGIKAILRASKIALSIGMDVKVAELPEGQDPADIIGKNVKDAWKAIIRECVPSVEFVLNKILATTDINDRKLGKEIKEKVLPYVAILSSHMDQEFFLQKISGRTGLSVATLKEDLLSVAKTIQNEKETIASIEKEQLEIVKKDYILRRLIGTVFWQSGIESKLIDSKELLREIAQVLNTKVEVLEEKYSPMKEDLIYEAEVFYNEGIDLNKDIRELVSNLKEENLKEELARKMRELYEAEEAGDNEKTQAILKECQIINNKIQDLKNSRA